jgi:16S rRNA (cytidine1402-2'-O)-methyltransferase
MNQELATTQGALYLVATPIGNLQDMTFRAIETLKAVDLILAEDTRHAKILLQAFNIQKPMQAFHAHNEAELAPNILQRIQNGLRVALISDAGTPLIQDPGFPLVKLTTIAQLPVIPIPGACAFVTALCASGVTCDRFLFAGFLSAKSQARRKQLEQLQNPEHAVILYESTHRIIESLQDIQTVFGEHYEYVLAKELTKTFEHFVRGTTQAMLDFFNADKAHCKGEFVLILPPQPQLKSLTEDEKLLTILLAELPLKQAVSIAEKLSTSSKNTLYKIALEIKT